jgi:phage N-6-adenine-methyltransferase
MKIDAEFKALIPPPTAEELEYLEASVVAEGCRDALVLWDDTLIDGHNRYDICTKHGIKYQTVQKSFDSRDAVKAWILRNQLARRNLTAFQRTEIALQLEEIYAAEAKARFGGRHKDSTVENLPQLNEGKVRDKIGEIAGVSGKQVDKIKTILREAPPTVVQKVRAGEISVNRAYNEVKAVDEKAKPHVAYNSGNNEWYTPAEYIDSARFVMGGIDLDPASSDIANVTVGATTIYTVESDGLSKSWAGRVWMNPPYSADLIPKFCEKLVYHYLRGEVETAIVLVNNATETAWFAKLVEAAGSVVFPRGRIRYLTPTGRAGAPLQGQAILYFGTDSAAFLKEFGKFGWGARID